MKTIDLTGGHLTISTLAWIASAIEEDGGVIVRNAATSPPGTAALRLGAALHQYVEDNRPIVYTLKHENS